MATERLIGRLRTKTTVECLWPYILALMKDKAVYAYEIRERISKRFGFDVGQVTAYMVLYRLENDGYVKPEWQNVENRQRKYYRITDEGLAALTESIGYFSLTADSLKQ